MINQQIYEEASEWFVRMRDGEDDPSVQGELMDWLRRSPEHVSAYLDIAGIWMEAKNVEADSHLDLAARIAAARADRGVTELAPGMRPMSRRYLNARPLLAIAASVFIVWAVVAAWWQYGRDVYSTALGEQRSIALADGSTVELNSQSRVRVRFDNRQRRIELLEGQALFHVTKDPARPFLVSADGTTVRAVGTVFDVYRKHAGAIITVVEGIVVVDDNEKAGSASTTPVLPERPHERGDHPFVPIRLAAGGQAIVKPGAGVETGPVNVGAAIAWTRRELVFEFTPLEEAAEEFNRYNARKLVIEGEPLRAFKVSAIFRSTDPRSLVRFMQAIPGVQVRESDDEIVITAAPQTRSL